MHFQILKPILVWREPRDKRQGLRAPGPATNTISSLVMPFGNPILKDGVIARRMRARNESNSRRFFPPKSSLLKSNGEWSGDDVGESIEDSKARKMARLTYS